MRRTATLALLTATLMVGSSAALAQTGPPSDLPAPAAQAQGSAQTGEDSSAEGRANAGDNAQGQGSAETGRENSAEGRATARDNAGFDVPAHDEARDGGREFGQERADDARARGDDETDTDDGGDTDDTEDPVDTDDVDLDEITDDSDATDVELPEEAPEQADQARGVLATITATFDSVLASLQSLFATVTGTV